MRRFGTENFLVYLDVISFSASLGELIYRSWRRHAFTHVIPACMLDLMQSLIDPLWLLKVQNTLTSEGEPNSRQRKKEIEKDGGATRKIKHLRRRNRLR